MFLDRWVERLRKEWHAEEVLRTRATAQKYADRAWMDGHVIKKSGDVVPKESV